MTKQELEQECVEVLRALLNYNKNRFGPEDCQECAIGQSYIWAKAKRLIKQLDAEKKKAA